MFLQWIGELGYYFDAEIGLFSVRERSLSPTISRWISSDPLLFVRPDEPSYSYSANSPLNYIDPSGLATHGTPGIAGLPAGGDLGIVIIRPGRPLLPNPPSGQTDVLVRPGEFFPKWRHPRNLVLGTTVEETISRIRGKIPKAGCLRSLEISGHATPGGISIGNDPPASQPAFGDFFGPVGHHDIITGTNASRVGQLLLESLRFCCPCFLVFSGCNTGVTKRNMLQTIANTTGCTAVGTLGYSSGPLMNGDGTIVNSTKSYPPIAGTDNTIGSMDNGIRLFAPKLPRDCKGKEGMRPFPPYVS
jgi:RHS repeat-associated protein